MKIVSLFLLLLTFPVFQLSAQQREHPKTYVEKGACPFECCEYRRWKTNKTTVAYASPNRNSRKVGTFKKGTWVRGLTGQVVTDVPGKYVVTKPHAQYVPGDIIWVYTPGGEGDYLVWFKGKMYTEEMYYMDGPYEKSYPKCSESKDCWGELKNEIKTTWWAKIRSPQGWIGWTDQVENFGNIDSCG